jgi:hypothetical protein
MAADQRPALALRRMGLDARKLNNDSDPSF